MLNIRSDYMNINFELYKVFYEVANEKSISKGAEKLLISQPAVTQSIKTLESELQDFLGFKDVHNAVIIGVGSLGAALIQDSGLSHYGLNIVAGFDINPDIVGTYICGIPIYNISELEFLRDQLNAEIGIIAVPVDQAQNIAELTVASGIKALWNFTPSRIKLTDDIVVQNTSIYSHLAVMYNRLDSQNQRER